MVTPGAMTLGEQPDPKNFGSVVDNAHQNNYIDNTEVGSGGNNDTGSSTAGTNNHTYRNKNTLGMLGTQDKNMLRIQRTILYWEGLLLLAPILLFSPLPPF